MEVLTFGITRDIVGKSTFTVSKTVRTVGELRQHLVEVYPELQKLNSLAIAVNEVYAEDAEGLNGDEVVALIPPVSGG